MSSACWMRVAASCERVLVDPEREDEARDDGTWGAGHEDDEGFRSVDLASGKYDLKYYYFDVLAADWLYLDGTVNTRRTPPSQLARLLLAWERECARVHGRMKRWPTKK